MDFPTLDHIYDGCNLIPHPNMNMKNRLFCTFVSIEEVESLIEYIINQYTLSNNKMFVLRIKNNDEYVVTYNIDPNTIPSILENTILVHRKKISNTLYTINALNELIKTLNNGIVDTNFIVNWNHYKNSILLTQNDELKVLKTKIHKMIEV